MADMEARVSKQMEDFTKALEVIKSSLQPGQQNPAINSLGLLEVAFNSFRTMVNVELGQLKDRTRTLELKNDALEAYSRRNCLLLFGVPEAKGTSEDECEKAAMEVFSSSLGVTIAAEQVERAHRLGKPRDKPRPIIIKFYSYKIRRLVFLEKKKLKGTSFMIGESLTKARLAVLNKARDHFGVDKCWTSDGKVLAKHVAGDGEVRHVFTNMDQLDSTIVKLGLKTKAKPAPYSTRSRSNTKKNNG